jgi:hypothetical protein
LVEPQRIALIAPHPRSKGYLDMPTIDRALKVVLIRLTKSYPTSNPGSSSYQSELYDATRMWWKIAASRTQAGPSAPEYAFAVNKGVVHAVYSILSWHRHPQNSRFGFTGSIASDLETKYVNTDVSEYFPKGAVNPIKFVNCAPAAQTDATTVELDTQPASDDERRASIRSLAHELDSEPLANIMLGGRELFHSNLLAWFGKHMPGPASDVFDGLFTEPADPLRPGQGYVRRTARERDHLDVCLWWDDRRPMVIENKVFSLPDTTQLDRYSERILLDPELPEPRQVLLSLLDPQWAEDTYDTAGSVANGRAWHRVSYGQLSERINSALEFPPASYEVTLMRHYSAMVSNLQSLADSAGVKSINEQIDLLNQVAMLDVEPRLLSSLNKMRARGVAQLIQGELDRLGLPAHIDSGFSNATSVITGFHGIQPELSNNTTVGWQLQGNNIRLFAVLPALAGKSSEDIAARVKWARENIRYFDFSVVDDILETQGVPEKPRSKGPEVEFNRFNPDFVYRSKKVDSLSVRPLRRQSTGECCSLALMRTSVALKNDLAPVSQQPTSQGTSLKHVQLPNPIRVNLTGPCA